MTKPGNNKKEIRRKTSGKPKKTVTHTRNRNKKKHSTHKSFDKEVVGPVLRMRRRLIPVRRTSEPVSDTEYLYPSSSRLFALSVLTCWLPWREDDSSVWRESYLGSSCQQTATQTLAQTMTAIIRRWRGLFTVACANPSAESCARRKHISDNDTRDNSVSPRCQSIAQ